MESYIDDVESVDNIEAEGRPRIGVIPAIL